MSSIKGRRRLVCHQSAGTRAGPTFRSHRLLLPCPSWNEWSTLSGYYPFLCRASSSTGCPQKPLVAFSSLEMNFVLQKRSVYHSVKKKKRSVYQKNRAKKKKHEVCTITLYLNTTSMHLFILQLPCISLRPWRCNISMIISDSHSRPIQINVYIQRETGKSGYS